MRLPVIAALLGTGVLLMACNDPGDDQNPVIAAGAAQATFIGVNEGDHLAASVTGDFDGDGALDIALAATGGDGPDERRLDAGELYILSGLEGLDGVIDLASEIPRRSLVYGPHAGASLGRALSVGDFNSDGIDDLAVSAPLGVDPASGDDSTGLVYVIAGSTELPGSTLDLAEGMADVAIRGVEAGDGAGLSLLSADFGGDGVDDLLIGAHLADGPANERADAGEAYIVSGASLRPQMNLEQDATATLIGAAPGDHLSETAATGSFGGDPLADIVIASTFASDNDQPGSGRTYILLSPLTGVVDLAIHVPYLAIGGADAGDQLGHSIGVGQADSAGLTDLWLGSVSADGPNNDQDLAGEAHLFRVAQIEQGIDQPRRITTDEAEALVFGPGPEARLGRSAAMAQVDGAGGLDLVIAATDALDRAGEVYVLLDGLAAPDRSTGATITYRGSNPDDILGHEVFGSPSLSAVPVDDRDGLLIASPGRDGPDETRIDCGAVYLIREVVTE